MPERASFDGSAELTEVKLRMLAPAPNLENEMTLPLPKIAVDAPLFKCYNLNRMILVTFPQSDS